MLPSDWRRMRRQIDWHILTGIAEMIDGVGHVGRVPIDDRGDHEVEARRPILLCFMATIDDPALPESVNRLG
jgi:hypothetical protein